MNLFVVTLLLIVIWYIGEWFGTAMQCNGINSLGTVKKFAYLMPVMQITVIWGLLTDIKDRNWPKYFMEYLFMPHKNLVLAQCLAIAIERHAVEDPLVPDIGVQMCVVATNKEVSKYLERAFA